MEKGKMGGKFLRVISFFSFFKSPKATAILIFFPIVFLLATSAFAVQISDKIKATATLNVRSCASTACSITTTMSANSIGTISNGPYSANSYTWWYISWDSGVTGYSIQDYLAVLQSDMLVQGAITVSPNPVTAGNSVTVSFTLKNQGSGNAGASTTKIQLKNASNVLLTQPTFSTPAVNAGSSINQSYSLSISSTAAGGTYTAYVILDNYTVLNQSNTSNDYASGSFLISSVQPAVNGACGSANGQPFSTAPTANLCNTGTASSVTGNGPWNWSCAGANGGSAANCSAAAANQSPHATGYIQNRTDTNATIAAGGAIPQGVGIILGANVTDPDVGDTIQLQIELHKLTATFTGVANYSSGFVSSGQQAKTSEITGLAPGNYGWAYRAVDSHGLATNWVPANNPDFVVQAATTRPSAPSLSLPTSGATAVSIIPSFSWTAVTGSGTTGSYRIQVATNAGDLASDPDSATCASCVINTTTNNLPFSYATALTAGTTYTWQVHALGTTLGGTWSDRSSFTTQAATAAQPNLQPQSVTLNSYTVQAGGQVTISWTMANTGSGNCAASVTGLRLGQSLTRHPTTDYSFNGSFPTPAINASSSVPQSTTVAIPANTAAGTYYVWVIADNVTTSTLNQVTATDDYAHSAALTVTQAGSSGTFYLSFPLSDYTPYSATINSVFDHSMTTSYCADGVVISYTGDTSTDISKKDLSCSSKTYNNANYYSYTPKPANISNYNSNYTSLSYDGHTGYDYRTTDQSANGRINVLAAADGTITLLGCLDTTNSTCYGTIEIDHGNGYKTRYLHLSQHNVINGQSVTRGQVIGISGDTGSSGSPHLHFEVRENDIPVDPYGWTGGGTDPYVIANVNLWNDPGAPAVTATLTAPALMSPGESIGSTHTSISNSSITFNWTKNNTGATYNLYVRDITGYGDDIGSGYGTLVIDAKNVGDESSYAWTGAEAGKKYRWQVEAVKSGSTAVTSGKRVFVTQAASSQTIINGACGSANAQSFLTAPNTNLCSAGSESTVTGGSGLWSWTCSGANGGKNISCTASVSSTPILLSGCSQYSDFFEEASQTYHIPSNLLRAMALVESDCTQTATNNADGGCGIMQLTGETRTGAASLLNVSAIALCENTIDSARLNILGGAAVLDSYKCWASPRVFSNDDFINCTMNTGSPAFTGDEKQKLTETFETWWWPVARYNGGGKDGFIYTTNYPYRVWNKFSDLNLLNISYPPLASIRCLLNGQTTPDGKTVQYNQNEISLSDDILYPKPADLGSQDSGGIRWTRPDLNSFFEITLHNNDGTEHSTAYSACTYSIIPKGQTFDSNGGTGSVSIAASSSNCPWTVSENLDWLTLTSAGSGTGNGTVTYSVSAMSSISSRTGNMSIAGQTFTTTQSPKGALSKCTLKIIKAGKGNGSISSTDGAIDCGGDNGTSCLHQYFAGAVAILKASLESGSTFTKWMNCPTANGDICTMTMDTDKTVLAVFDIALPSQYTLTVNRGGTGTGSVTAAGIDCGSDCEEVIKAGDTVTLTATPDSGSKFTGWGGGGCSGTDTCTITMDSDITVSAAFSQDAPEGSFNLTVILDGTGSGDVTAGASIDLACDSGICSATVEEGKSLTLTATPSQGTSLFSGQDGWNGCDSAKAAKCTVKMTEDKIITITFIEFPSLTITVDTAESEYGIGTGAVIAAGIKCSNADGTDETDCDQIYNKATKVTLKAIADKGSEFSAWDGCDTTRDTICTVTIDAEDKEVIATFIPTPRYTVSATKEGNGTGKVMAAQKGVDSTGINCDADNTDCESTYGSGTTVVLVAKADKGVKFTGWSGYAACEGKTTATCKISKLSENVDITATFGSPEMSLSVDTLEFGNVDKNDTSAQTFTISNNGYGNLTASFKISGTDAKAARMFKVYSSGKAVSKAAVAAGTTSEFEVRFKPTSVGDKAGTLTISSNDPNNPKVAIQLSGSGK